MIKNRFRFKLTILFFIAAIAPLAIMTAVDIAKVCQTGILEFAIAILASLFFILVLSATFSRYAAKPLESLKEKAELISKGRLKQEIKLDTNDEIEDISKSFNKTANGLQEIQKLKDEFIYIVAHELRTPVTAVRGYLSMTLNNDFGKLTPELKTTLQKINGANEQLMRLVNDLLEMAKSEAPSAKIEVEKVDLVKTMQTVIDSLSAWAQMLNIKLFYEHPQSEIYVMANEDKLIEVLNNLGSNGVKYNKGGGTVIFSHQEKKNEVAIIVKDTGIGMTEKELPHLFEKFYRAKNQESLEASGTGLGLFIAKQLIEKMGGKISVKSEAGKGSAFSFTLKKG
ncbi:MAG: HAMP domain-containing sensor histidine kinase [bacterium]